MTQPEHLTTTSEPQKRKKPLKDKWLHLKVSEAERSALKALASEQKVTVADLVRKSVEEKLTLTHIRPRIAKAPTHRADPALLAALGRLGSNLNQIGRWVNTHKSAADAVQVLSALVEIERQLKVLASERPIGRTSKAKRGSDDAGPAV